MVDGKATSCPHCRRRFSFGERLERAGLLATVVLIPAAMALGSLGAWVLIRVPAPMTSFAMSAGVCGWYTLRSMLSTSIEAISVAS